MECLDSLIDLVVEPSRTVHLRGKTRLMNHIGPAAGTLP